MRVQKQISDAIRILAECYSSGDELVKVATVADRLDMTRQMALKLTNILRQVGFLETLRGPTGGIKLSDSAREASVGEIVRVLLTRPELRVESAEEHELDKYYEEAFDAFLAVLDKQPLSDLAARKPAARGATKRRPAAAKSRARQKSVGIGKVPSRRAAAKRTRPSC